MVYALSFANYAYPDVLVRVDVQQGSAPIDSFDIRLFENAAPNTVSNFLNYVNATTVNGGSYNNSFFHRNAPGFIIQTGGFIYDPLNGGFAYDNVTDTYPYGLGKVVQDATIVNEFNLSNVAGTLAMAKIAATYEDASGTLWLSPAPGRTLVPGTGVDSATSQWFINLADNSANLDSQNGGFTVFGEVLGNGMTVVNALATNAPIDQSSIHPNFNALPLVNYAAGQVVDETKLVKITGMNELVAITGDVDFGVQVTSISSQRTISITNKSTSSINIGAIAFNNLASLPFSIINGTDTCSGTALAAGISCSFILDFSPTIDGGYSNSINIDIASLAINYTLSVSGRSAAQVRPFISTSTAVVDYGEVGLVLDPSQVVPKQIVVLVNNDGNVNLNITSVTLSGADAGLFEVFDNCKQFSPIVPGAQCVLPVNLYALVPGVKNASVTITSDDPDRPSLVIPITAIISEDLDGVAAELEDQSSLSGDGNFDGFFDRQQSNVASFKGGSGKDITLVSESFIGFSQVVVNNRASLISIPDNVNFDYGAIQFRAKDNYSVGAFDVGMILPANVNADSVYLYGPTTDNSTSHWYRFDYDGSTGEKRITTAEFTTPNGTVVTRKVLVLGLVDGGRGDNDMLVDGKVEFNFAISVAAPPDSTGNINMWLMGFMILSIYLYRKKPGYQ